MYYNILIEYNNVGDKWQYKNKLVISLKTLIDCPWGWKKFGQTFPLINIHLIGFSLQSSKSWLNIGYPTNGICSTPIIKNCPEYKSVAGSSFICVNGINPSAIFSDTRAQPSCQSICRFSADEWRVVTVIEPCKTYLEGPQLLIFVHLLFTSAHCHHSLISIRLPLICMHLCTTLAYVYVLALYVHKMSPAKKDNTSDHNSFVKGSQPQPTTSNQSIGTFQVIWITKHPHNLFKNGPRRTVSWVQGTKILSGNCGRRFS